jgi:ABC-type multidrug transport system ATPase subunit
VIDEAPLTTNGAPEWFEAGRTARAPLLGLTALLGLLGVVVTRGMSRGFEGAPTLKRVTTTTTTAEATGTVLQTRGLTKRYGERAVLNDLDLTVNRGEAVALWGGNGAGKTTAIRCVVGVIKHEGDVVVNGVRLADHPKDVRRAIGYVPQDQQLPDLPSRDLLAFFGALRGVDEAEFLSTAELVGIEDHLTKRPNELSGGLRQRLALALALLGDPPLLLLDEPTANLDAATRESIFALLDEKRSRGTSVVFTTHRADEVIAFADRVITLEDGRSVDEASADAFARGLQGNTNNILIRVADAELTRAQALLASAGLSVTARAGWLTVHGAPPDEPLRILFTDHIEVIESAIGSER